MLNGRRNGHKVSMHRSVYNYALYTSVFLWLEEKHHQSQAAAVIPPPVEVGVFAQVTVGR